MNIIFIIEGFDRLSAIAQPWGHVYEISKRAKACGNDVEIWTDEVKGLPSYEEIGGVPVSRLKKGKFLFNFKEFLESLNKSNADIINWFSGPLSSIYLWRFRNTLRKKVVWTIYKGKLFSEDLRNIRLSWVPKLFEFRGNFLYSLCPNFIIRKGGNAPQVKIITTWTQRLKRYLLKIGIPDEKIFVIPSGVNIERFRPLKTRDHDYKEKLGFHKEGSVILYFGPLSAFRGTDTLVSAMPMILKKIPSAKLVVLARQPNNAGRHSRLERILEAQGSLRIVKGIQSQDMLIECLDIADVVILPFRFWPHIECPLTVLEAMAMEKPIVATYTGSIPEFVRHGETGILVNPGDREAIAKEAITLLTDKELSRKIGRRAREYVERFHDWNNITKQTMDIFNKIVG